MKKHLLIASFFLLSVTMIAQKSNNKYEVEWKQVERFEKEQLPQSATKVVEDILAKAIAEKNTTQVVKTLIYRTKYKVAIDNERMDVIFPDMEKLAAQTNDVAEKALLKSMLAELYSAYYQNDQWTINQRTKLADLVPEDMKEWSSNIFKDKIIENVNASVQDIATLKTHTTQEYDDIIRLGDDAKAYYPTLYDFLMERAISLLQNAVKIGKERNDIEFANVSLQQLTLTADQYTKLDIKAGVDNNMLPFVYYQNYMRDLLNRNLIPTVILTEISKLEYLSSRSNSFNEEKVLDAYIALEQKYRDNETSVEIIDKITNFYGYNGKEESDFNKKKYDWLQKGIKSYPNYKRITILKNKLGDMEEPQVNFNGKELYYPNTPVQIGIMHRNVQLIGGKAVFRLYKVTKVKNVKKYMLVKEYPLNLTSKRSYDTDTLTLKLDPLSFGRYSFAYISQKDVKNPNFNPIKNIHNEQEFTVSALMPFARNSAENEYEIIVVDRNSGKPIKDATVEIYNSEYDDSDGALLTKLKTNELGIAVFKDIRQKKKKYNSNASYKVVAGLDSFMDKENLIFEYYRWNQGKPTPASQAISVFIDRSIYRPGQTVYFKAIVLSPESKPVTNKYFTAKLYNANNEVVSEKKIISNEYGSLTDNFTLPQSGRLGSYRLEVDGSANYFRVEEYKRPTFEITFDKLAKTYTFGEEIKLKGYAKNFSGISLQDSDVKYTIARGAYSFWFWGPSNTSHFADGMVKTSDDGAFEIAFTPKAGDSNNYLFRGDRQIYTFTITATVTDVNGETQSNTYTVTVGNVSMVINVDIPAKMEKSGEDKIKIEAKNLQGETIETSGTYTLYLLNEKDSIQNKVLEGTFKTGEQPELKDKLKSLASGKYQLQIKALDDKKNEVSEQKDFILYSYNDKKPPIKTNAWLIEKNITFGKDGKPIEVIFGASDKDIYVLYQLYNNKTVFERRFVKISEANETFKVPYKAEYGDEIHMSFIVVKDGNFYNEDISLAKEGDVIDTKLDVKLEVFRDKLRPGQEETWTISVKDTKATPVVAELLASMYDSSLDKLYPYTAWAFNRPYSSKEYLIPISYYYNTSHLYERSYASASLDYDKKREDIKELSFDKINWFGYLTDYSLYGGYFDGVLAESVVVAYSPRSSIRRETASGMLQGKVAGLALMDSVENAIVAEDEAKISENGRDLGAAPQIRRNFNETAFFFPQLRTNEKGETLVSFTVPESNTTWRFRALAHDKNARVGTLEQMVVTRKELMVTPNMPRFVRQGDKTSISTKISNLSENAIAGDVRIEFFDPLTDKVIDINVANQKQPFSIEKDASGSATWTFDVPNDIELIGCRIVAQNATFSDGEQHTLAVLSNRMLVTESMPIDITKAGTSTFTFDKLKNNNSSTLTNYNLTLEYASNPAWYAVQTLPTMSNPSSDNAVSWFASYYVNTLGASIMRQYPKVGAMIEAWKKQGGDKETLVSKLQKNEELKAVLLEETPWVLDAKDETEQMQKLSLLFDLNNSKQLTNTATAKLAELVTDKGGWSWYKNMYPSRSVTQYILYGYTKLQRVGKVEYPQEIKQMQISALNYVDKQIAKDFADLKKYNKEWQKTTSIYTGQLEYLYVRSSYRDIPISKEAREAERFYTSVASTYWTKLNLYERSLLAVLLKRNGDIVLADKLAKSLAEYTIRDEKQGMYWANNRSQVFMSMSAISTHVFLMEALQENGASVQDMDMMKRWLINQKRTQVWESTHASIDAIGALLSSGSDWFADASAPTSIIVGGNKVEPDKKEQGTGYFKTSWSKAEINNNMARVEVTTADSKPAYGALYWQYYENLDKVTTHKTEELNIGKQLFKEEVKAAGKGLTQITENNPLTVGDKVIVRLTIRADRDMEFVHLKDMRAPCFEPQETISGMKWRESLMYYQNTKDASTNFYFDHLPKGTYVLEYPVYVNRSGEYANGITTIQCMYAPEYVSHTLGIKVIVKDKK